MRKNLMDPKVAQQTIERASRLRSDTRPVWGNMKVREMLHHCNSVIVATMDGKPGKRSSLKQHMLRWLFLFFFTKFPKNARAPKRFRITAEIPETDFDKEISQFVYLIDIFSKLTHLEKVSHPVFGRLSSRQWGYFTWMHLDHHLRQFRV